MFSRSSPDPTFLNHDERGFFPDRLFSFLWEDMKVENVEFDIDAGKIVFSKPVMLVEQTLANSSDIEQEMTFNVGKSVANSSTFEYGTSFTAAAGMELRGV